MWRIPAVTPPPPLALKKTEDSRKRSGGRTAHAGVPPSTVAAPRPPAPPPLVGRGPYFFSPAQSPRLSATRAPSMLGPRRHLPVDGTSRPRHTPSLKTLAGAPTKRAAAAFLRHDCRAGSDSPAQIEPDCAAAFLRTIAACSRGSRRPPAQPEVLGPANAEGPAPNVWPLNGPRTPRPLSHVVDSSVRGCPLAVDERQRAPASPTRPAPSGPAVS